MVRRLLGLVLVSLVVYNLREITNADGAKINGWEELSQLGIWDVIQRPLKRNWFQTLMHIAVTSLWILLVIRARASIRILFMIGSAILHIYLSYKFNYAWANGIDRFVFSLGQPPPLSARWHVMPLPVKNQL